jgi:hypothetical protein
VLPSRPEGVRPLVAAEVLRHFGPSIEICHLADNFLAASALPYSFAGPHIDTISAAAAQWPVRAASHQEA